MGGGGIEERRQKRGMSEETVWELETMQPGG